MNNKMLTTLKEKFKLNLLKELKQKILNLKNNREESDFFLDNIEYLKKFKNPLDIYPEIDRLNKKITSIKKNPICNEEILNNLIYLSCQLNALKDNYDFFSTNINGTYNFLQFYGEKLFLIKNKINSIEEEISYLSKKIIPFPKRLQRQQQKNLKY